VDDAQLHEDFRHRACHAESWIPVSGSTWRQRFRSAWRADRTVRVRRKVIKWAFFTLIFGFLSIAADLLVSWLAGDGTDAARITLTGEPFLVALAISVGSLGELIFDRKVNGAQSVTQAVATGASIIVIVVAAIAYGATRMAGGSADPTGVIDISERSVGLSAQWLLVTSIGISFWCVSLSEWSQK
jgi:hypothetical protein